MMRWILFIVLYVLLGLYAFQLIRNISKHTWVQYVYILISLLVLGNFLYQFWFNNDTGRVLSPMKSYAFGFLLTMVVFYLIIVVFALGEDLVRLVVGVFHKTSGKSEKFILPSRRKFISTLALGVAAVPFASMLYGMYRGKYNYQVLKYDLEFDDLPEAFDGYTITQISDIHCGSFDNKEKIAYGIDLINKQQSDVILFTGDMVNNRADELNDWQELFSTLYAKDGKFAVLGNHDYGDYFDWNSEEEKEANLQDLKDRERKMGFDLLLNETRFLEKNGQRIALMGVENWGAGGFKKAGDLQKTKKDVNPDDFKILMSHDPTHWEQKVLEDDYHYHITLAGHTHGMQFGIEIPGWVKWSPARWRYKHWAGIYNEKGEYINVNRGFGYLGYPGRVGIWPEVTVIRLKKAPKSIV
ncbi:metallophosphoesterase [Zhouia sp. PK063]|uniref:metallophosphoesterase n=1 Tax=Zhouia sp. PK063 TaxID=3373602 RepID=UPI0037A71661